MYTLAEEGGVLVIRRPDGEPVFRIALRDSVFAYRYLDSLNEGRQ